jgi:hypothetical protein
MMGRFFFRISGWLGTEHFRCQRFFLNYWQVGARNISFVSFFFPLEFLADLVCGTFPLPNFFFLQISRLVHGTFALPTAGKLIFKFDLRHILKSTLMVAFI